MWEEALGLKRSPPASITTSADPKTDVVATRSLVDPSTGAEVIELMSSADSDVDMVVASAEATTSAPATTVVSQAPLSFLEQCVSSLHLALTSLLPVPGDGEASAIVDDLCGPMPPADVVGAASLRVIMRICGSAAVAALANGAHASLSPVSSADAQGLLAAGPAMLVAYRASLAVSVTQLWHACNPGPALTAHAWLHQLTAPSLLTALLWEAIDPLERGRRYEHTLPLLYQVSW